MIRFDNVSKIYSTDVVLKDINWEIRRGEKIGLVGSNGAGKSTQFKILIGEEDQTSGQVLKEGSPKISHLKQEFDCDLNRTVREELESSFEDIQLVSNKLLEIEDEMKYLESIKDSEKLDHLVNQLAIYQEKFEALGGYQMQAEIDSGEWTNDLVRYDGKKKIVEKAKTIFKVIDKNSEASLLELKPITGRKHQLRKQLYLIGQPIFGDTKYKLSNSNKGINKNLMLHSYQIRFIINDVKHTYTALLPDYFRKLLKTKRLNFLNS